MSGIFPEVGEGHRQLSGFPRKRRPLGASDALLPGDPQGLFQLSGEVLSQSLRDEPRLYGGAGHGASSECSGEKNAE